MTFNDIIQFISGDAWVYGGAFLLVLGILVFVHEWGHFIIAKLCGVKVEVFSVGFGKEIIGFNDKHGTRWKISLIPLGGYVKLFGDVDPASYKHDKTTKDEETEEIRELSEDEKKVAFFAKPVWQRAAIVFAGPAINYLFAIIILCGLYSVHGKPVTSPIAAAVIEGSSAYNNGFEPHDQILSIDNKDINSFEDIRREMMIALDHEKHFVIEREGQVLDIYAAPTKIETEDRFGFKQTRGLLGLISPRHVLNLENISTVNGKEYENSEDIRQALLSNMNTKLDVTIKRGPTDDVLKIKPYADLNQNLLDSEAEDYNYLYLGEDTGSSFVKLSVWQSLSEATRETYFITTGTIQALWQMITGARSATELGGIIRIGAFAGDMAKQGMIALILFTALLSINLGLINLFPIPLLDGGHLLFYSIEAIIGKPVPDQIQEYAYRVGMVFLIGIMAFANINDIMQLIL